MVTETAVKVVCDTAAGGDACAQVDQAECSDIAWRKDGIYGLLAIPMTSKTMSKATMAKPSEEKGI